MGTEEKKKSNKSLDLDAVEEKVRDIVEDIDLPDLDKIKAPDNLKKKLKDANSADIDDIERELGLEEPNFEATHLNDTYLEDTYPGKGFDDQDPEPREDEGASGKEVDKDGSFTISLGEDLMSVTIDLYPSEGNGQPLTMESVKDKLKSMKVVYGINFEILQKLIKKVEESKNVKKGVIIARGQPPKEGKNGWIEYKFSDQQKSLLREKE